MRIVVTGGSGKGGAWVLDIGHACRLLGYAPSHRWADHVAMPERVRS